MNIITMDTIYYVLLGIIVAFIAVRIAFVVSIQIDLVLVYFGHCLPLHFIRKCNSFVYVGCIVLAMVVLASMNKVTKSQEKAPVQERVKHAEKLKIKFLCLHF